MTKINYRDKVERLNLLTELQSIILDKNVIDNEDANELLYQVQMCINKNESLVDTLLKREVNVGDIYIDNSNKELYKVIELKTIDNKDCLVFKNIFDKHDAGHMLLNTFKTKLTALNDNRLSLKYTMIKEIL